jgi:uncharacterized cupin superfamily protein
MAKINIDAVPVRKGSSYPPPFNERSKERIKQALGNTGNLTDFGVNLTQLPPGEWSSQRHYHSHEDEFIYILSGEVTLITDDGEQILTTGDCAAFPKNVNNAHHIINNSKDIAYYLEIGSRSEHDVCCYPDVDLNCENKTFTHKNGSPYE